MPEQTCPLAARTWSRAKAGARALSSDGDATRLLADGLRLGDGVIVLLSGVAAYLLRHGFAPIPLEISLITLLALVITMNVMHLSRVYAAATEEGYCIQMGKVVRAWSLVFVVLLILGYLTKTSDTYSRLWVAIWYGLALCAFAALRAWSAAQTKRWAREGRLARTVAIVELGGGGKELLRQLQSSQSGQFHLIGLFSAGGPTAQRSGVEDLIDLSRLFRIDEVLVVAARSEEAILPAVLRKLGVIPTNVRVCPFLAELGSPVREVGLFLHSPVLTVHRRPLCGWGRIVKRSEDVLLAAMLVIVLGPLMLIIAILVSLDSPGPVLFRQQRLGFNNNVFVVFKFRTMKHRVAPELSVPQARRDDPRVTAVGRFLRRLSLDELPQLFNVLRGEMSLVGPRPHALAHNEQFAALIDDYLGRHRVQPGITGWAQVNGFRGETDTLAKMQRRVECDLAYIDRWSIMMDIRIMLLTVMSVLFDRNAY